MMNIRHFQILTLLSCVMVLVGCVRNTEPSTTTVVNTVTTESTPKVVVVPGKKTTSKTTVVVPGTKQSSTTTTSSSTTTVTNNAPRPNASSVANNAVTNNATRPATSSVANNAVSPSTSSVTNNASRPATSARTPANSAPRIASSGTRTTAPSTSVAPLSTPSAPAAKPTPVPGPNVSFSYPLVLLSKSTGTVKVVQKPEELNTISGVEELKGQYTGAQIIEGASALYNVQKVSPLGSASGADYPIQMQAKLDRLLTLNEVKAAISAVIKAPNSRWSKSGKANAALNSIKSAKTLPQLMQSVSKL